MLVQSRDSRPQIGVIDFRIDRDTAPAEIGRRSSVDIVGYEDPTPLQLVLEAGAVAVIERPIRPFGLLTNLTIARSLWLERREMARTSRVVRCNNATLRAFSISWTCFVTDDGASRSWRAAEEKLCVSTTAAKHLSERMLASFRMLFGRTAAMALSFSIIWK